MAELRIAESALQDVAIPPDLKNFADDIARRVAQEAINRFRTKVRKAIEDAKPRWVPRFVWAGFLAIYDGGVDLLDALV